MQGRSVFGLGLRAALLAAAAAVLTAAVPEGSDRAGKKDASRFINGQLLVARPGAPDSRFAKSVILMVSHNKKGAFGLIINKRLGRISAAKLLKKLGDQPEAGTAPSGDVTLHYGGPVAASRVFVVHSSDFKGAATIPVNPRTAVTTSADILRAIALGKGPKSNVVALGYSGWGAGQLEGELKRKFWLVVPFEARIVFDGEIDTKWKRALDRYGVKL